MNVRMTNPLLSQNDPAPVELVNGESASPLILLCEHAGQAIPAKLGDLGVDSGFRNGHRGWDIGARDVAVGIADALQAPLIIQNYSRLVLDANRPPQNPDFIPEKLDGVAITGNQNLDAAERNARIREIFEPMDQAINDLFAGHVRKLAISIHSYTPALNGVRRPWHAGFLSRFSKTTAIALMDHLSGVDPSLNLGLNEPYEIDDETDWFIPRHAEPRNMAHCLVEIRNDQIDEAKGCELWAGHLSDAIKTILERL